MRINHNIPALRTLHQMGRTNSKIDKTMQRLSSGLRINSASDDAAGLAISQKMHTQVRGLEQANRNSMDGISLIQTAEGALNEVHSMLQRTRELAIQASNGTLTPSDRKAITDEVEQLKQEIDRISEHIEYNERKLLNGEIDRRKFSDKDTAGKVISMSDSVKAGDYTIDIKSPATQTTLVGDTPIDSLYDEKGKVVKDGIININGEQVEIKKGDTEQDVFAKIRNLCDTMGLDISVEGGGTYSRSSKLIIVHREYGEKDLEIKGDTSLLEGLGLDGIGDARPTVLKGAEPGGTGTDSLFDNTPPQIKDELSFEINGEKIELTKGDTEEVVFDKIKAACDKQGIELSIEGDGEYKAGSQLIFTSKENGKKDITITSASGDDVKMQALGLKGETGELTTVIGDVPRNLYDSDGGVKLETGKVKIAGKDITITKGMSQDQIEEVINDALKKHTQRINAEFDKSGRLILKNVKGGATEISIEASDAQGQKILEGLGLKDPEINLGSDKKNSVLYAERGQLKGLTKGKDVQIDDKNLLGFPDGSTYKVKGNMVTFEGNNNFKLAIEAGQTKKDPKTGDFESGKGIVAGELSGDVTFTLLETGPLDLQIGANEGQMMQLRIQNMSTSALGLTDMNLNTSAKSQEAITLVDNAIAQVSSTRSKLGAYQNRLEHTVANLDVAAENMTNSMSRIQDADMAKEMAEYTKDNILSQAGNAMLAQANQRPQQILQLLQ